MRLFRFISRFLVGQNANGGHCLRVAIYKFCLNSQDRDIVHFYTQRFIDPFMKAKKHCVDVNGSRYSAFNPLRDASPTTGGLLCTGPKTTEKKSQLWTAFFSASGLSRPWSGSIHPRRYTAATTKKPTLCEPVVTSNAM